MITFLTVVILIVCFLLGAVILVQNPKGGGLATGFQGASQIGGVQRTTNFLEKSTWFLAVALSSSASWWEALRATVRSTSVWTRVSRPRHPSRPPSKASFLLGKWSGATPCQPHADRVSFIPTKPDRRVSRHRGPRVWHGNRPCRSVPPAHQIENNNCTKHVSKHQTIG